MYIHESIDIKSSDKLWQPFACILMKKKCSQDIELPDVTYCKHKDKFLQNQGFLDKDFHRRNYLAFYYDHEDLR
jgi:transcription initiation factor TFIID subunit TAF12